MKCRPGAFSLFFLVTVVGVFAFLNAASNAAQSFGLGFAAPQVIGTANVYLPGVGDIVFDESTNLFYGYGAAASWMPMGAPVGSILAYGGSSAPTGYLMCDGAAVSRTTYSFLYNVIGVAFGSGDGSTTFNVPDMRGQFPRGNTASMTGGAISALSGNNVTVSGHGFNHSGVPVQLTGTPPTGLTTGTTYYEVFVDTNTLAFATTLANALAGTKISLSGSAGGTVVQWQDPDSGARTSGAPGGNSSGLGSTQADQFGSHNHGISNPTNVLTNGSGTSANITQGGGGFVQQGFSTQGGNETRAKNAYVNFIIKY